MAFRRRPRCWAPSTRAGRSSPIASRQATWTAFSAPSSTRPPAAGKARPREVQVGSRSLARPGSGADRWFEFKSQVHYKLVNSLTAEQLKDLNKENVRGQIGAAVEKLVIEEALPMTMGER